MELFQQKFSSLIVSLYVSFDVNAVTSFIKLISSSEAGESRASAIVNGEWVEYCTLHASNSSSTHASNV